MTRLFSPTALVGVALLSCALACSSQPLGSVLPEGDGGSPADDTAAPPRDVPQSSALPDSAPMPEDLPAAEVESPAPPAADAAPPADAPPAISDLAPPDQAATGDDGPTRPADLGLPPADVALLGDAASAPTCERLSCGRGTACFCCPVAGPVQHCTCSIPCQRDDECPASAPKCNVDKVPRVGVPIGEGFCTSPTFFCCWNCR